MLFAPHHANPFFQRNLLHGSRYSILIRWQSLELKRLTHSRSGRRRSDKKNFRRNLECRYTANYIYLHSFGRKSLLKHLSPDDDVDEGRQMQFAFDGDANDFALSAR
jgi:hypothetical protein